MHFLCTNPISRKRDDDETRCSRDYSFDDALSSKFNCRRFLFDPFTGHPSQIGNNLQYFGLGANILGIESPKNDLKGPFLCRLLMSCNFFTTSA